MNNLSSKKIVINASAAKYGGAKTIIDGFITWIAENDKCTSFILLAPHKPDDLPENVLYSQKETSGISTLLFSCLGVVWTCLKFRASHCISFNNVNLVLPTCRRITYFHQAKVFTEKSLRFRLIALAIHMLRRSTIVIQSPLIQQRFANKFSSRYQFLVKWPGIKSENTTDANLAIAPRHDQEKWVLWPVTDPHVSQKNLAWLMRHKAWLVENQITLLVTSDHQLELPNSVALGKVSRAQMFDLYKRVDAVLIVSIEETLCLPIFEAASLGGKVKVLRMPYIEAIKEWRGLPENVQLFNDVSELSIITPQLEYERVPTQDHYFEPDWQIY